MSSYVCLWQCEYCQYWRWHCHCWHHWSVTLTHHSSSGVIIIIVRCSSQALCVCVCVSVSIASTDADTVTADITDLSPSHLTAAAVSSSSSSVAVVKPCVSTSSILLFTSESHDDSVDRAWREHVNEVLTSSVAGVESRAVRTFYLFPRLFYVSFNSFKLLK